MVDTVAYKFQSSESQTCEALRTTVLRTMRTPPHPPPMSLVRVMWGKADPTPFVTAVTGLRH